MITVLVLGGGEEFELNTPAAASAMATPPSMRIVAQMAMIGHLDEPPWGGGDGCAVAPVGWGVYAAGWGGCAAGWGACTVGWAASRGCVTNAALPAATLRSGAVLCCPYAAA